MVIQCPECRTRFKLADEKLKPEGIKVRCARCQQVFAVRKEEPEAAPCAGVAAASLSEAAAPASVPSGTPFGSPLAENSPPLHSPSEEEPWKDDPFADEGRSALDEGDEKDGSPDGTDDFFDFRSPLSGPEKEVLSPFKAPEGETDPLFTPASDPFGENPPLFPGDADEDGGTDPFSETKGTEEGEAEETIAFGFDEERLKESPSGEEIRTGEAAAVESPEEDVFSFGAPVKPVEADLPPGETPEFSFDEEGDDFTFPKAEPSDSADLSWESLARGEEENPFAAPEPAREKDEFDFGDASPAKEPAAAVSVAPPPPLISPALVEPAPAPAAAAPKSPAEESPPPRKGSSAAGKGRSKSPVSPLFLVLALLLLALAGGGAYLLQGGPEEMARVLDRFAAPPSPQPPPSQIRLVELRGSFVQNGREGQLFVISGEAVNDHAEARSAISVKGILYNEKGEALLQQTVFAGNPFSEEALKQLPFSKIEEGMNNQFGDSLSNLNVAPGKSIPFTIVFKGLPANLAEFTVEVADSRPGSKT